MTRPTFEPGDTDRVSGPADGCDQELFELQEPHGSGLLLTLVHTRNFMPLAVIAPRNWPQAVAVPEPSLALMFTVLAADALVAVSTRAAPPPPS
jgi:hypothetical protein